MRFFAAWLTLCCACGDGGETAAADAGTADAGLERCTIYPQSGCGAAETCALRCDGDFSAQLCRPATAAGTQGKLCPGGSTDCAANHICIGEGDLRVCRQFCEDDDGCVGPGGHCIELESVVCDGGLVLPAVPTHFCTENCDPLDAAACDPGLGCQISFATSAHPNLTYCTQVGAHEENAECLSGDDCTPGTVCISGRCRRWCVVGQACDVPNRSCTAFPSPALIGTTEYGRCLPP